MLDVPYSINLVFAYHVGPMLNIMIMGLSSYCWYLVTQNNQPYYFVVLLYFYYSSYISNFVVLYIYIPKTKKFLVNTTQFLKHCRSMPEKSINKTKTWSKRSTSYFDQALLFVQNGFVLTAGFMMI